MTELESLIGYVARIAESHGVTVPDLVGAELSHPACPTSLFTPYPGKGRSNFFSTQVYSVNGIEDVPRKWVNVLETATLLQWSGLEEMMAERGLAVDHDLAMGAAVCSHFESTRPPGTTPANSS
jgi:hypothetical protein